MIRYVVVLAACLSLALAGCGGGGGGDTPATVALTGTVVDVNDAPLANIRLTAAGASVQTNAAGRSPG